MKNDYLWIGLAIFFFAAWMLTAMAHERDRRKRFEDAFNDFCDRYGQDRDLAEDEYMRKKLYKSFIARTKNLFFIIVLALSASHAQAQVASDYQADASNISRQLPF